MIWTLASRTCSWFVPSCRTVTEPPINPKRIRMPSTPTIVMNLCNPPRPWCVFLQVSNFPAHRFDVDQIRHLTQKFENAQGAFVAESEQHMATKAALVRAEEQLRVSQLELTKLKEQARTEWQRRELIETRMTELLAVHRRDLSCLEQARVRIAQLEAANAYSSVGGKGMSQIYPSLAMDDRQSAATNTYNKVSFQYLCPIVTHHSSHRLPPTAASRLRPFMP